MAFLGSISGSQFTYCIAAALLLYAYVRYRSYSRLKHIPGPPSWGWTIFPLFMLHLHGTAFEEFHELSKKYGPLVRISPNTVLVSDPDELRKMSAPRSNYTRAPWYMAVRMMPGLDNVFSMRNEQDHNERRRKLVPGYSGNTKGLLENDVDGCVLDLIDLINRKYVSNSPDGTVKMDLARKVQFLTSDVISQVAFGDKFHDLKDDTDHHDYIREVEAMIPSMVCLTTIPSVLYFLTSIGVAQYLAAKGAFAFAKLIRLVRTNIDSRFDSAGEMKSDKGGMLASFLRNGLTRQEAEQEGMVQLAAGSDTTATSLRATLLAIISNPRVYGKLSAEIDEAVASGRAGSSESGIITEEEARKLPYLQACIKEGLRWFPPVGGMLSKYTPPEGDTICGYSIPGKVDVAYSMKAIHHSPALFGPDVDAFRPERWILTSQGGDESSKEKIQSMERNNDLIFGHGKYQCLGKSIAGVELNKVFFELIRRFEMTLVNPIKPWKSVCYGIHLQKDLWVTVRRRS